MVPPHITYRRMKINRFQQSVSRKSKNRNDSFAFHLLKNIKQVFNIDRPKISPNGWPLSPSPPSSSLSSSPNGWHPWGGELANLDCKLQKLYRSQLRMYAILYMASDAVSETHDLSLKKHR